MQRHFAPKVAMQTPFQQEHLKKAEPYSKCQTFFELLVLLQQDESVIKYLWM